MSEQLVTVKVGSGKRLHAGFSKARGATTVRGCPSDWSGTGPVVKVADGVKDVDCRNCPARDRVGIGRGSS